jgi:tetratricopeptide (TPR) repeat protein
MTSEYHFHATGNKDQIREALNLLDGVVQSMSARGMDVEIKWKANTGTAPFERIAHILREGNLDDGILLLELFLSDDPDDANTLYNLGMAYSDKGNLERAIELLTKLVGQESGHINGRVALGVALLRARKTEAGIKELEIAVAKEPENPWARRNLGAGLIQAERFNEAVEHLCIATEISPQDQQAWYGYGQALEAVDKVEEADEAYTQTIEIDEYNKIAELARKARSNIAKKSFRETAAGVLRMDAVMYCLGALEKFDSMSADQVQKIGFEIAILGTRGIDVNNPDSRYTIKSLPGEFSGLHLLSLQYVAFKKIAPEQNIGFDLSAEYEAALKLFGKKK